MSDEFLSVSEAAKRLGVSARRIRQLIENEELGARRIGNSWAIPAAEVSRRGRRPSSRGRPYERESVWRLAALADAISHQFLSQLEVAASWDADLRDRQEQLVHELSSSLWEICQFNPAEVVDNPPLLAELRKILSRAQLLSRRDELLAGALHEGIERLQRFEARAKANPLAISEGWLHILGGPPEELEFDQNALRSLRNKLMHRLAPSQRNIAAMRSRYDEAEYFYAHPSLVGELLDERRFAQSGEFAAAQHGLDLIAGDNVDAYVSSDHANELMSSYSLQHAASFGANVVLRIVDDLPDHHPLLAPRLFVALDLQEKDDPRSQKAGADLFDALSASVSFFQLASGSRWM
jgi:excisionase family DNA binding protein